MTVQSGGEEPSVRLALEACAENVAVVRQALAGLSEALDVEPDVVADMKLAVTEACTNVVVHAYGDGAAPGRLELDALIGEAGLTVAVRDHGRGMGGRPPQEGRLGLGLPLIASLSETFAIAGGAERGTEVRMSFPFRRIPNEIGDA